MLRSQLNPMPHYFDRYINKCDDVNLETALQNSLQELESLSLETYNSIGDKVYEVGKWTIKDILQHLIDTERVFSYRITAFARGDKQRMLSFAEAEYAKNTNTDQRTIPDLIEELKILRKCFIMMFQSFDEETLQRVGNNFSGTATVISMGFMIAGHQRWHLDVVKDKYINLL